MATEYSLRSPELTLNFGDRVAVTGASGFIGSAIVRALHARGLSVVAICQPGTSLLPLQDLDAEVVEVDLTEAEAVKSAVTGARVVFHVPPDYRAKALDPRSYQMLNVEDTRCVLEATRSVRCDKIVYTSSVATIGLEGSSLARPADETFIPQIDHLVGAYKQSKYVAEHEVLREAAEGLPVTLVLPTTSVGEHDYAPTPSGRIILDYLNGQSGNWFDTTINIVDVDDLASGYLLAAERGPVGRSYILGGENVQYRRLFAILEQCTGLKARGVRVPRSAALATAMLSEVVQGRILRRQPSVPIEGVRLASQPLIFSDARARRELGYAPRPAAESIAHAARWFADTGFVSKKQLDAIHWSEPPLKA